MSIEHDPGKVISARINDLYRHDEDWELGIEIAQYEENEKDSQIFKNRQKEASEVLKEAIWLWQNFDLEE